MLRNVRDKLSFDSENQVWRWDPSPDVLPYDSLNDLIIVIGQVLRKDLKSLHLDNFKITKGYLAKNV